METRARQRSTSCLLEWSLSVDSVAGVAQPTLTLAYEIHAFEELYVTDRLWDHDTTGRRITDPFGVYRFVSGDRLRLVFAQAPHASNLRPHICYAPLSSRVRVGEIHRRQVAIALPVDEYSALARNVAAPTALDHVSKVDLVFGIRCRSEMDRDPAPPLGASESVGYLVHDAKLLVSSCDVEALPVRRRTVYMPRFALPGEPPPGPAPLPSP
jgi:hypothetical protein